MKNPILIQERLKWLVAKLSPIILKRAPGVPNLATNILFEELDDHLGIIGRDDYYEDEKIVVGR